MQSFKKFKFLGVFKLGQNLGCYKGAQGGMRNHHLGILPNCSLASLASLVKGWKMWGNPYLGMSMVVSPVLLCGYNLYTSVEFWKPEVFWDETGCSYFYAHGSDDDDTWCWCEI